jgi:response regulator RpfG family c-di-GMP phosphodiesterase
MSTQARILVLSGDADTQEALAEVARPLGFLLMHAGSSEELASRVRDLHPELVIVDADAGSSRDLGALRDSLQVPAGETRPQVLLLVRTDDSLREALVTATAADDLIDKPFDLLDMQVRMRALVRVHRLTAQAMRDRDLINALFELTALGEHDAATSTERVLSALAGQVAEWSGLGHVVVTLGPPGQPRVVAEVHRKGGRQKANSLVERRHAELVARGEMLLLGEADGALAGEAPGSLPYVGLPLRSFKGDVLGVLHAWGPSDAGRSVRLPSGAHLRVLRVAAERITTEIQLHTNHRLLEEMVEARTSDLTAALDRLRTVNAQLLEASRDTVMRLARAAEYRDGDTGEHVERMSSYAQVIARQMGMSAEEQGLIKLAAPMHDVGKIGIPDAILLKQGKLTAEEYAQMKAHPAIGAKILAGSRSKLLQMAEAIAAAHHEKWDGTGYPAGHQGEQIPLVGRIVALADVFDALTSPRVYKSAWTVDDAVAHIQRESGKHFDPAVVAAFEDCLDQLLEIRASFTFGTAAA